MVSRPILMPKLGLTMEEGMVVEWRVAPGDRVKAGDVIFVVETDKIENEIEVLEDGVVETLLVQAGEVVPVGEVLATLTVDGSERGVAPISGRGTRVIATPRARRLARDAGLDIRSLSGSGPRGRIVARDVSAALEAPGAGGVLHVGSERQASRPLSAAPGERREQSPHQRIVARRMSEAKREIPHFYIFAEADLSFLIELRAALNADAAGRRVSVNHFIVTAVARALEKVRGMNVIWSDGGVVELQQVDVGIAVETAKGLVAPVLRNLGSSSVDEVAEAADLLVERARANRLTQDDLQGAATTVSNVGMFGATGVLPIINPGQSSILGVGRTRAVFRPDARQQPQARQVLDLSLSCDHRVIVGALAARFLQAVQSGLEAPVSLLRRPLRGSVA